MSWAGEWCAIGWRAVYYGLGSRMPWQRKPRRRSGSAGKARHHCWGEKEEEERPSMGISLCARAWALRV